MITIIIIDKEETMKRHSKQRDAVRKALCSVKSHPTASAVYDMVRAEFPNISLATVYRNLAEMHNEGDALMLTTKSGAVHFDADTSQHSHLCCSMCGGVSDLSIKLPNLCEIANETGCKADYYILFPVCLCMAVDR